MKFEYKINNLFTTLNIHLGICILNKSIKRNPKKKLKKCTTIMLYILYAIAVMFITTIILYIPEEIEIFIEVMSYIMAVFLCFDAMLLYSLLYTYFFNKKDLKDGYLLIENDSISDYNDGKTIKLNWDKIDFIAIKNNIITIIVKRSPLHLVAELENTDKFIEEVKNKNKDLLIIEQ